MITGTSAVERFLDTDKSLACIHCGLCLSSCPTYLETGNENDSPRGRIHLMRAVQEGRLPLDSGPVRHIDLCLGCRACEAVCPSGVEYGALLEGTRDHIERHHSRPAWQRFLRRFVIEQIFPYPERMELALAPVPVLRRLGLARILPKFVREMIALVPDELTCGGLPASSPAMTEMRRGRVGLISGCVMSVMFGKTHEATVRLLNRAGYDVVVPKEQGCCGALYAHGGNLEAARTAARRNIDVFERQDLDAIVVNAAGCGSTLKEYDHLLHDDPAWGDRAGAFSRKVKDLTEFLAEAGRLSGAADRSSSQAGGPESKNNGLERPALVAVHDACHLAHAQRITKAPRDLVKAVSGANYVELPESDVCCGSAGSYNLIEPEMAERLQRRKTENILKTGASVVVTTNPGCLLQIRAGLDKAGAAHVEAIHIADYLDRAADG